MRNFINRALAFLFTLLAGSLAIAADCVTAPEPLHLTYPAKSNLQQPVAVQFALEGDLLHARFEIKNPSINAKRVLAKGEYPYQHDVVELFLSVNSSASPNLPYYEFELSPYDQTFNVQILDLHKPFINNIDIGSTHHAEIIPGGWRGQLTIPLKNIGWSGDVSKITGNAYAITGASPQRSYWSLSIPQQPKPNFHQPQFFRPLVKCASLVAPAPTEPSSTVN